MVHVHLMFLSEWREFPSAPCFAGKKNLMTSRVSMLLKSRASPDMLPFSLCNNKRLVIRHLNRPLFPTTLSIPSYDIEKYVGLRTYQHPHVCWYFRTATNNITLRDIPEQRRPKLGKWKPFWESAWTQGRNENLWLGGRSHDLPDTYWLRTNSAITKSTNGPNTSVTREPSLRWHV